MALPVMVTTGGRLMRSPIGCAHIDSFDSSFLVNQSIRINNNHNHQNVPSRLHLLIRDTIDSSSNRVVRTLISARADQKKFTHEERLLDHAPDKGTLSSKPAKEYRVKPTPFH